MRFGAVDFEFSYQQAGRILRLKDGEYPRDSSNVVISIALTE